MFKEKSYIPVKPTVDISEIEVISPIIVKAIESPISTFNTLISDISRTLSEIIFSSTQSKNSLQAVSKKTKIYVDKAEVIDKLSIDSQIFFIDDSIVILGIFKLHLVANKMILKVIKPGLGFDELSIMSAIHKNYDLVSQQFFRYIMIYNRISKNFDDVPMQMMKDICNLIYTHKFDDKSIFLLPFKNKLSRLDIENDWDFYDKYELMIKFSHQSKNAFKYQIIKCVVSKNVNNTNLESLRYEEIDYLKSGQIHYSNTEEFIKQLFCYGEIINPSPLKLKDKPVKK